MGMRSRLRQTQEIPVISGVGLMYGPVSEVPSTLRQPRRLGFWFRRLWALYI